MKRIAFAALICVLGVGCEQTPQEQAAEALQQEGIFPQHYAEALQKATREGNAGLMRRLICAGAPLHLKTADGGSLLHLAAGHGQAEAADVLVLAGLNLETKDALGLTPIQRAILQRQFPMIQRLAQAALLNKGIESDIYAAELNERCRKNDFYTAHLIFTAGYAVDTRLEDGGTQLHRCAAQGEAEAVQWLIQRGADYRITDAQQQTPLDRARANGQLKCAQILAARELADRGILADAYTEHWQKAVCCGELALARLLQDAGADITVTDKAGNTAIHLAIEHRQKDMLTYLHSIGLRLNARNKLGMTPLLTEISCNSTEHIPLLHQLGANMHQKHPDGRTPLQYAVTEGFHRCIEPLAMAGAQVNAADSNGNTLLHFCAAHGQQHCLRALIRAGAAVTHRNHMRWSALHYACTKGNPKCAQILIQAGAADDLCTAIMAQDDALVQHFLTQPQALLQRDGLGCTPLHWAARLGHTDYALLLLHSGADATATDHAGRTPGDCAQRFGHTDTRKAIATEALLLRNIRKRYTDELMRAIESGDTALTRLLCDAGADADKKAQNGNHPLHAAVFSNHSACIPYLLQAGANANSATPYGYTALHLAVSGGRAECLTALLQAGVTPHERAHDGSTPLHLAASLANHELLQLLLQHGARVEMRNGRGDTPLIEVCRWSWGRPESAEALLRAGADPGATNILGDTALHAAAASGNRACIEQLLRAGAYAAPLNHHGKTPYQLAKQHGHADCANLIKEAEPTPSNSTAGGVAPH